MCVACAHAFRFEFLWRDPKKKNEKKKTEEAKDASSVQRGRSRSETEVTFYRAAKFESVTPPNLVGDWRSAVIGVHTRAPSSSSSSSLFCRRTLTLVV